MKKLPPPQWYFGAEGLETVQVLLEALRGEPYKLGSEGPQVLEELEDYDPGAAEDGRAWVAVASGGELAVG